MPWVPVLSIGSRECKKGVLIECLLAISQIVKSMILKDSFKQWFPSVHQTYYSNINTKDKNQYIENEMVQFKLFLFQNEMEKSR